jgi:biopolymer transport protein ExbB/TolQ
MKTVGSILAIIMLLTSFFGVYRFMEGHYALAEELQRDRKYMEKIEKHLDFKIADDKRISFQKEMREIEERNLGKTMDRWDSRDRKRYQVLQDELKTTQDNLKEMK